MQLDLFAAAPAAPALLTEQERHWHKHMARLFLQMHRHYRTWKVDPAFQHTLMQWAAERRRKVQAGAA